MSKIAVTLEGRSYEIELDLSPTTSDFTVMVNGKPFTLHSPTQGNSGESPEWLLVDEQPFEFMVEQDFHWIRGKHGLHCLEIRDLENTTARPRSGDGRLKAPIPGLITRILVNIGDTVEIGQPIIVLEAMKMENELRAGRAGTVSAVHISLGQSVLRDEVLAEIS